MEDSFLGGSYQCLEWIEFGSCLECFIDSRFLGSLMSSRKRHYFGTLYVGGPGLSGPFVFFKDARRDDDEA